MTPPSVAPRKTWRFRLYPTAAQRAVLEGHLRLGCELYNAALQERRDAWRLARMSIGFTQQSAQLPAIKVERPDVACVYSEVLQDVLHRVDDRHLHVSKVGAVKIKRHRPIDGRIKTLTIKREAGKWFACFSAVRLFQAAHAHVCRQRADMQDGE